MEFKGTKGRWETYNYKGKGSCIDVVKSGEDVNSAPQIAQVYSMEETTYKTPHNEELIANAKLIAAAPDLLKALKAMTDNIDEWLDSGVPAGKETSKILYDNAKIALQKALK